MLTRTRRGGLALAALAALALAACDNPVDSEEEHAEPTGLIVRTATDTLVTVQGTMVSDTLRLTAGGTLGPLEVVFVDAAGAEIHLDDEPLYLDAEIANTGIATFTPTAAGAFTGTLQGASAGTTTVQFNLMHGAVGTGHPDFEPAPIPIVVAP